jgi:pilus assembly protein Flp/PilA
MPNNFEETKIMLTFVLSSLANLHRDEEGQGLVEYLLILALVAFAAVAGMNSLASYLNVAFSAIGSLVNKYIS